MENTTVRDMLTDLLDAAVDALTPTGPGDPRTAPPDRQVIEHGPLAFAWDCEMVAVAAGQILLEPQTSEFDRGQQPACIVVPRVTLAAWILRCWPTADDEGNPPDASAISAAAEVLAVDGASLSNGLVDLWSVGTLFPTAGIACGQVLINPGVEPLGPSGGLAGWRITLSVRF